jgi:hypothetical protein
MKKLTKATGINKKSLKGNVRLIDKAVTEA